MESIPAFPDQGGRLEVIQDKTRTNGKRTLMCMVSGDGSGVVSFFQNVGTVHEFEFTVPRTGEKVRARFRNFTWDVNTSQPVRAFSAKRGGQFELIVVP